MEGGLEFFVCGVGFDSAREDGQGLLFFFELQEAPGVGGPHEAFFFSVFHSKLEVFLHAFCVFAFVGDGGEEGTCIEVASACFLEVGFGDGFFAQRIANHPQEPFNFFVNHKLPASQGPCGFEFLQGLFYPRFLFSRVGSLHGLQFGLDFCDDGLEAFGDASGEEDIAADEEEEGGEDGCRPGEICQANADGCQKSDSRCKKQVDHKRELLYKVSARHNGAVVF